MNHPRASRHNWLIYKVLDPEIQQAASRYAKGKMLDVGCGVKPYREMFAPYVTEHIGLDHEASFHGTHEVDIFGPADHIPCGDGLFDTVLCTEVLEHLEDPARAIGEMSRVLKVGGHCILTTPFFWHIHEAPRDFFRFSRYGLQYLFESHGFSVIELRAVSGFWVTFCQELAYYLCKFLRIPVLNIIVEILIWLAQVIGFLLDKIDRDENFATEYIIVGQKKI